MSTDGSPEHNPTATGEADCYHCGEPVPAGADFSVELEGCRQLMCCPGCRAVAQLIAGSGMGAFYQQRTAYSDRPPTENRDDDAVFALYDDPEIYQQFSQVDDSDQVHASLLLGGITCAACTWLIEQSLLRLAAVQTANVNMAQSKLEVTLHPGQTRFSELFRTVESLGYKARPFRSSALREQLQQEQKASLRQLAVAGLGMMQVGMFAIGLHAGDIQGMALQYQSLLRWVSLLVASVVVLYSARSFFVTAFKHLRVGTLVMDLPVALAIGLAWTASFWATLSESGQVYFDSVVMFTFFLLLGRYLERRTRQKTTTACIDTESNLPLMVKVKQQQSWQPVARQSVHIGDLVLVAAGETVPVDGDITAGTSTVDESAFSGEHLPRPVAMGDPAYAGTINLDQALEIRATSSYIDTRLAALQQSLNRAQREKPALARLADRVASWFIAGVLLATAITALIWLQLDPERALWIALSVLVISCPCALALATPAALTSAASALRTSGIVVHGENALEVLARATHLVLDKTGTLTEGRFCIAGVELLSDLNKDTVLSIAATLQRYSSHPIATAFHDTAPGHCFDSVDYHVGLGIEGCVNTERWRLGSPSWCQQITPTLPPHADEDYYWVSLCRDQTPIAWIALDDTVRPEAAQVVAQAQSAGLQVELLSGDSSSRGPALARELGLDDQHCAMSPQQKMDYVQQLQQQGAVVAMVGDGLNDAPVLASASVSFAVAGATDLARAQADLVISDTDLRAVTRAFDKARHCRRVLMQNIAWALGYNICGIPLAALGYVPPWAAAIGMSASSLLVVLNSLRLNRGSH